MDVTIARPKSVPFPPVAFVGVKALVAAAAVYALCIAAPGIYATNSAIREFEQQSLQHQVSFNACVVALRDRNRHVLEDADTRENPADRSEYLQKELGRAEIELEGYQQRLKSSQAKVGRLQTLFHRITGNKLLQHYRQLVRDEEVLMALALAHVDQLTAALQQCHEP